MKRAMAMLLAVTLTAALAGCAAGDGSSGNADTAAQPGTAEVSGQRTPEGSGADAAPQAPGRLLVFPPEEGGEQVLAGVRLTGNRSGSEEFNSKDPAADGVRCIFELNEWVGIYPDTTVESGLQCWVFGHRDDPAYYRDNPVSEDTQGFVQVCDLNRDPEDGTMEWGSFYLSPEECGAGLYDLVFTCDGRAAGVLLTRFYKEEELSSRSDAELEQLMQGILS